MTQDDKKFEYGDGVSLKEYVDLRFTANQQAIEKAERTMNTRLEGMNEFRDTLKDQASRFLTREEVRLMIEPINTLVLKNDEKISSLELTRAELAGKASQASVYIAWLISGIGIALSVLKLLGV
jgi:hypothetical protein